MTLKIKIVLLHVILPLIVGSLIYLGFRSHELRMFEWFNLLGISKIINVIRRIVLVYKTNLPDWIYFSLPDALWTYSFASAYLILWQNDLKMSKCWLLLPLTFSCIIELGQAIGFIKGTFDIVDLTLCFLAILVSIQTFNQTLFKYEKTQHIQNL